jgi:hypothetical protein
MVGLDLLGSRRLGPDSRASGRFLLLTDVEAVVAIFTPELGVAVDM